MSYATYSDFNTRYATRMEPAEVESHYLPFATARLDSALAGAFAVPFSSNNLTARDLTLDLAYLLMLQRNREQGDRTALEESLQRRLSDLREGREAMLSDSGDSLFSSKAASTVWGGAARYHTVYGPDGAGGEEP